MKRQIRDRRNGLRPCKTLASLYGKDCDYRWFKDLYFIQYVGHNGALLEDIYGNVKEYYFRELIFEDIINCGDKVFCKSKQDKIEPFEDIALTGIENGVFLLKNYNNIDLKYFEVEVIEENNI